MALGKDGSSKNSSSYKPYDASDSFVKKITNRVTGLIGWRGSSFSSVGDEQQHIVSNTSSSDEGNISPTPKRIKIERNSDLFLSPSRTDVNDAYNSTRPVDDITMAGPSTKRKCIASSTPANTYPVNKLSPNTSGNMGSSSNSHNTSANYLDNSNLASSNISLSLPSVTIHQKHNVTLPVTSINRELPSPVKYELNKSLNESWTTPSRRPSFNPNVLSASNKRLSLSVCENRSKNCLSPFYSARTMYGGASALLPYTSQKNSRLRNDTLGSDKLDIFSPVNQITIQPIPSPATDSNDQETMSAAARRILDTLEKYCSPIRDAKRMPVNESSKNSSSASGVALDFMSRGVKRKLPSLSQVMPRTTDLLRIKRQEKTNEFASSSTLPIESDSSSSDSADLDYTVLTEETDENSSRSFAGKIKKKYEKKFDDRPLTPVKLPNAVLKISSLPKFNITDTFTFSKPLLLENLDTDKEDNDNDKTNEIKEQKEENVAEAYKSDVKITDIPKKASPEWKVSGADAGINNAAITTAFSGGSLNFAFSKSDQWNSSSITVGSSLKLASNNKTSHWTCKKCLLDNESERCSSCSSSKPMITDVPDGKMKNLFGFAKSSVDENQFKANVSFNKSSSDMFDTNGATKSELSSNAKLSNESKNEKDNDKGKNNICSNNSENNASNIGVSSSIATTSTSFFTITTTVTATTTTSTISVNNDSRSDKKNTDIGSNNSFVANANDVWKNLQKQSEDSWKCDDCWVKNKKSDSKCAACGAPNKAANKGEEKKTNADSNNAFTFGIDTSKSGQNAWSGGAFKFGVNKSLSAATTSASTPTGFTFGFAAVSSTSSSVASSAGSTSTLSFGGNKSMPQFSFGCTSTTNSVISANSFKDGSSNLKPTTDCSNVTFGKMNENKTDGAEKTQIPGGGAQLSFANDVSSSTNTNDDKKRLSFATNNDVAFKSLPNSYLLNKENGEETSAAGGSTFNDISSSTETLTKKKTATFSSIFNKDNNATATTNFGGSNGFSDSEFKSPSSTVTTSTSTSTAFPSITGSVTSTVSSITTNSNYAATNSFVNSNGNTNTLSLSTPTMSIFNAKPEITPLRNEDKNSKMFSANVNSFGTGSAQNAVSVFGNFSSDASKSETTTAPATAAGGLSAPAFNVGSTFRFGSGSTSGTQPAPGNGGFTFNGPKLDSNTPKFGFGASVGNTGTTFGGSTQFNFGSSATTTVAVANNAPNALSVFSSPTLKMTQPQQTENPITKSITSFGATLFGSGGTDPNKKSGGFNFTPTNQLAASAGGNFSCFSTNTPVDGQDANRLNNVSTSSSVPFVFGSTGNQTGQAYNFNTPVTPSSFNFTGGNVTPSFTAQPTVNAGTAAAASSAPMRRIKKAVRRTNK